MSRCWCCKKEITKIDIYAKEKAKIPEHPYYFAENDKRESCYLCNVPSNTKYEIAKAELRNSVIKLELIGGSILVLLSLVIISCAVNFMPYELLPVLGFPNLMLPDPDAFAPILGILGIPSLILGIVTFRKLGIWGVPHTYVAPRTEYEVSSRFDGTYRVEKKEYDGGYAPNFLGILIEIVGALTFTLWSLPHAFYSLRQKRTRSRLYKKCSRIHVDAYYEAVEQYKNKI